MAGTNRGSPTGPSPEVGIVDLPDPHARSRSAPPPPSTAPSNLYLYAAALVVAVAVLLGLQGPPGPAPDAPTGPSAGATPARPSTAPGPRPQLRNPEHLALDGSAGFLIGGVWVSVDLPAGTEADYYPLELLDADSPHGGITITTASAFTNRCLALPEPSPGGSAPLEMPPNEVPGWGTASRSTFALDGYPGYYLEFTGGSDSCHPNIVWDILADGVGGRGRDVSLQLWILDVGDEYLVLGRYSPVDEDAPSREGTRNIVASLRADPAWTAFDDAGRLAAGPIGPGWYWVVVDSRMDQSGLPLDGLPFVLHVPDGGWHASGSVRSAAGWQLEHGSPPDGAVVRIGRVDGVYSNPCSQEEAPPPDPSASALADAVAAIPGVEIVERSQGRTLYSTVEYVALTIPAEIPCAPQEFFLWYDDVEGPRAASAIGSTIRLWIFTPNDRDIFGRVVFEAETMAAGDPTLDADILQMFYSIQHGG